MRKNQMEIRIKDLDKYYGRKHALKHLTLTIPSGMFGLLGRNGAGKTTLMKVLATLLKKQSGEVTICGIPVEEAAKVRRITGYLPQDFSMYPNMGVYEAMDYLGALSGLSRQTRKERIPVLLKKVNLQDEYRTKVRALSGGMKRRLGIAQAILHEPKVLIVDEPTAGLDPQGRDHLLSQIKAYHKQRQNTVILVSHSMEDIARVADRVLVMNESKVFLFDETAKVFSHAKELEQIGLRVPQVTKIMMKLHENGYPVDPAVFTLEQAVKEILPLVQRGAAND